MSSKNVNHIDDVYMAIVKGSLNIKTNSNLAARLGLSDQSLSNMKSRGTLAARLAAFAKEEGIDLPDIQFKGDVLQVGALFADGFIMVPFCSADVQSKEGLTEDGVSDEIAFGNDWISSQLRCSPANLALLTTIGDSMEPTFRAGDQLLIDRSINKVRDEAIYALQANGIILIKRVRWRPDGGYTLVCDNPGYENIIIDPDDTNKMTVLGRVVWWSRRA